MMVDADVLAAGSAPPSDRPAGLVIGPPTVRLRSSDLALIDGATSVEEALGNAKYLGKFDVLLLYANHGTLRRISGKT